MKRIILLTSLWVVAIQIFILIGLVYAAVSDVLFYSFAENETGYDVISPGSSYKGVLVEPSENFTVTRWQFYMTQHQSPQSATVIGRVFRATDNFTAGNFTEIAASAGDSVPPDGSYSWIQFDPDGNSEMIYMMPGHKYLFTVEPVLYSARVRKYAAAGLSNDHTTYYSTDNNVNWLAESPADSEDLYYRVYGSYNPVYIVDGEDPMVSENNTDTGLFSLCVYEDSEYKMYVWPDGYGGNPVHVGACGSEGTAGTGEPAPLQVANDIGTSIDNVLEAWGMANVTGRTIVTLLLMIISWAYFAFSHSWNNHSPSKMLALLAPSCIFAVAFAIGWVSTWIFVLIAIIVGFTLWRKVRGESAA